jgi:hypothetical protein
MWYTVCLLARVMFSRALPLITLLVIATGASALGACGDRSGNDVDAYDTDADGCTECKAILVECSSTSRDEQQFVECRDQWLKCERGKGLGPDACRNPGDAESCDLCRQRLTDCKKGTDAAQCDAEFGVCKAFLITRGDIARSCTQDATPPVEVACGICQKDYAACVSDGAGDNGLAVCGTKFDGCMSANGLSADQCAVPSGGAGCLLCQDHFEQCQAAAGSSCVEDFGACAQQIAPAVNCTVDGGQGGSGQGGQGGGGSVSSCSHDECVEGEALLSSCSSCASQVCAQDSWCCDNQWDVLCLDIAKNVAVCGC